jgi:hypothetical protein
METRPDASSSSAVIDRGSKDCAIATGKTFHPIALPRVSVYVCLTAISAKLRRLPARATEMLPMLCEMTPRGAFGCGADRR